MNADEPRNLGDIVIAYHVRNYGLSPKQYRNIILLLAACVALMMTGFGIILPVFARRLGEFGAGVQELGLMTLSFALAQFFAAPIMGSMADRYGRRPLIILALTSFTLANIAFLLADSIAAFVAIRAVEGALGAGLFPAAMGVVADVVPDRERARWVGIVMGGYAAGFLLGPVGGGVLYDSWGFAAPFLISAVMAALGLLAAILFVPETRTAEIRRREKLERRRQSDRTPEQNTFLDSLPRPIYILSVLLFIDFILIFAFAFVEPEMVFYLYDDLGWTTVMFGVVIAAYGLLTVLGQGLLGQLSDRFGRKPIIVLGLLLTLAFYGGLAFVTSFPVMLLLAAIAGLGEALIMPALSAFYMDITKGQHRSRVMGLKESAAALGGVVGPLLVFAIADLTVARQVFLLSFVLILLTLALVVVFLKEPQKSTGAVDDEARGQAMQRAMLAQATFHGIVTTAQLERERRLAA